MPRGQAAIAPHSRASPVVSVARFVPHEGFGPIMYCFSRGHTVLAADTFGCAMTGINGRSCGPLEVFIPLTTVASLLLCFGESMDV